MDERPSLAELMDDLGMTEPEGYHRQRPSLAELMDDLGMTKP